MTDDTIQVQVQAAGLARLLLSRTGCCLLCLPAGAQPVGRKPQGRPRKLWWNLIFPQEELELSSLLSKRAVSVLLPWTWCENRNIFKATSSSSVPSLVKVTMWESFKMSQEIKTQGVEHIQESRQRSLQTKQYHTHWYSLMAELDTVQPLTCAAVSSSSQDVNSHYSCAVN